MFVLLLSGFSVNVFGHGGNGVDRAPELDLENRKVTVLGKMSPSDMTVGDFSNAFMEISFVEVFEIMSDKKIQGLLCEKMIENYACKYDVPIKQITYAIVVTKDDKLLARHMFYDEDGVLTIDIRPDDKCSIEESEPWKCAEYFGSKHPLIPDTLYTLGQNNPVIDGPIFTQGGQYDIKVEILGAESPRSNLLIPLEFELFVSIAQEQIFYIDVPNHLMK